MTTSGTGPRSGTSLSESSIGSRSGFDGSPGEHCRDRGDEPGLWKHDVQLLADAHPRPPRTHPSGRRLAGSSPDYEWLSSFSVEATVRSAYCLSVANPGSGPVRARPCYAHGAPVRSAGSPDGPGLRSTVSSSMRPPPSRREVGRALRIGPLVAHQEQPAAPIRRATARWRPRSPGFRPQRLRAPS